MLKNSGRVIPSLVMHRILAAAWLRATLSPRFRETAEGVLALIGCAELFLPLVRVTALPFFHRLRPELPHHVTVLPGMNRRSVCQGVVRAGALE